jgi:hypothetical protein
MSTVDYSDDLSIADISMFDYISNKFSLSNDISELLVISMLLTVLVFFIIKMDYSFTLGFFLVSLILFSYLLHVKYKYDQELANQKALLYNRVDFIKEMVNKVCEPIFDEEGNITLYTQDMIDGIGSKE